MALSDPERAIADYQKSARLGHQNSLRELARLHKAKGDYANAAAALEGVSYQTSREHLVADTLLLVEAYLATGGRARARERLEKARDMAIQPRPLRAKLRELYEEDRDWNKLADLLRVEADAADDKP